MVPVVPVQPHSSLLPVLHGTAHSCGMALGVSHSAQRGQRPDPAPGRVLSAALGMERGCSCQGMPSPPAASPGCVGSATCRSALAKERNKVPGCPLRAKPRAVSPSQSLSHPQANLSMAQGCGRARVSWEGAGFSQSSGCPPVHTIPTASTPVGAAAPGSAGMSSGMWVGSGKKGAGSGRCLGQGKQRKGKKGGVQWTRRQQGARGSGAAAEPGDKVTAILPALRAINRDNWE